MVLALVAALGLRVGPGNTTFPTLTARSMHYLVRMGLFRFLGLPTPMNVTEHDPAGRFIPLTQIKSSADLKAFIADMIPLLHLDQEPSETLGYIFSELVRNVLEHARTEAGALVAAQYYVKSNSIRIGIVDTGVGIKRTIAHSYNPKDDLEAIKLALTPGVTGTTRVEGGNEQNAGAGLFFVKSIANVNRSLMVVYSGKGFYKLLKKPLTKRGTVRLVADPDKDRHSESATMPEWRGTAIGVDIVLDHTWEFDYLIKAIGDIFSDSIRDRRKARFKRPRFA